MPEHLKDLMHETADLDFAPVDVAAITRAGNRVVRRRRVLTGVAGVAATAVLGAGLWAVTGGTDDDARVAEDDAPVPGTNEIIWVEGSVVHRPATALALGVEIRAFVRTGDGLVMVDEEGIVHSHVGGNLSRLGTTSTGTGPTPVVADAEDSLVGWVDFEAAEPEMVIQDLESGEQHRVVATATVADDGVPHPPVMFAIDAGTAYWLDAGEVVAYDFSSSEHRVLGDIEDLGWIGDVENGRILRLAEDSEGGDLGMEVMDTAGEVLVSHRDVQLGTRLSPDARWVTLEGEAAVYEVATGRIVPMDVPGADEFYFDGVLYEWLDDDTVAVVHEREQGRLDLLSCEVPAGSCTLVVEGMDVPGEGVGDGFLLPGFGAGY